MKTAIRQRLDPATRCALILDEALRQFAGRHYSLVTVRDVAEACGINAALIHYYFESKDQLFRRTIGHVVEGLVAGHEARHAGADDPKGGIDAWLDMHVELAPTIGRMLKIIADYAASAARDAATDALIADFYRREQALLEDCIGRGVASGLFADVDVAKTARTITLHLDGIFHASASRGDDRILEDIDDLRDLVATLLCGMAWRSPGSGEAPLSGLGEEKQPAGS